VKQSWIRISGVEIVRVWKFELLLVFRSIKMNADTTAVQTVLVRPVILRTRVYFASGLNSKWIIKLHDEQLSANHIAVCSNKLTVFLANREEYFRCVQIRLGKIIADCSPRVINNHTTRTSVFRYTSRY